jgi:hypothetical protein
MGLISPEVARHDYAVVLDRNGAIDAIATESLRSTGG